MKAKVLPFRTPPAKIEPLERAVAALEKRLVRAALEQAGGSVYEASRLLELRSEDALRFIILRRHPELAALCKKGGKA